MVNKSYVIIGMGQFGESVARELLELNADFLVIDASEERIRRISHDIPNVAICNSKDMEALKELGVQNCDHAIVAIGEDVEASIMTTLLLQELGIPKITVKVLNDYHAKVVTKLGATEIIKPETEAGKRLAHRIVSNNVIEYFEVSSTYCFVEISIEKPSKITEKTLAKLDLRNRYGINVVAIRREGEVVIPRAEDTINVGDIVIVIGKNATIAKFEDNYLK